MLVLTRRIGGELQIADEIRVTVLRVDGGRVKIGIDAPPSVSIRRGEIQDGDRDRTPGSNLGGGGRHEKLGSDML